MKIEVKVEEKRMRKDVFKGYERINIEELKKLKNMSLKKSIRLTEVLLKEAERIWKR